MTRLGIGLYTAPEGGDLLLDLAALGTGHAFSTNRHGFGDYSCVVPRTLIDSFWLYDRAMLPWVRAEAAGGAVWQGRAEDFAIVNGGVRLTAFGAWRALSDVPYTSFWSQTGVRNWRALDTNDVTGRTPQKYVIDFNKRLYLALKKGEEYLDGADAGALGLVLPDDTVRDGNYITVAYSYVLPANWRVRLVAFDSAFSPAASSNITTAGGTASGTATWTIATADIQTVAVEIMNLSGSTYTVTDETGDWFAQFTSVRATSSGASIVGNEIAAALVAYVSGINPTQLSSSTALIGNPAVDLKDEVYEDELPADILDHLAEIGDGTANRYEAMVWEDRRLTFRRRNTADRRVWYIDVTALELDRTLEALRNSVYATYQDESGRTLRTAVSADSGSVARYGLTRREAARANTTSSTDAENIRNLTRNDKKDARPRASLVFRELYDAAGVRWPLWAARAGDRAIVRNLPPTLSVDIDRVRAFLLSETRYQPETDTLEVVPEAHRPRADLLLARLAAGIGRHD